MLIRYVNIYGFVVYAAKKDGDRKAQPMALLEFLATAATLQGNGCLSGRHSCIVLIIDFLVKAW